MSTIWDVERIKKVTIGERIGKYEGIPTTQQESEAKQKYPHLFEFEAISIGDEDGQAFFVPLDESSRETAEFILRAIAAYNE